MTILIRDRSEKINSLMSRGASLIKVLGRRWGGTRAGSLERDEDGGIEEEKRDTVRERDLTPYRG